MLRLVSRARGAAGTLLGAGEVEAESGTTRQIHRIKIAVRFFGGTGKLVFKQ